MSPLEKLQRFMAARSDAAAELQYISAIALRDLSVKSRIDAGLAGLQKKNGKAGTVVMVLMPVLSVEKPNPAGPLAVGRITLRCQENPIVNTTGMTSEEVALFVLSYFHHWSPGFLTNLRASKDAIRPSLEFVPLLTHDVTFEFDVKLDQVAKAAAPTITVGAETVSLASTLADAAIWYTTDGTMPAPANGTTAGNGTLYEGPFARPAAGVEIVAAAYKADFWGSNASIETITE